MRLRQLRGKTFLYLDDAKEDKGLHQADVTEDGPTPEEEFAISELSGILRNEIAGLPPLMRQILILRDLNESPTAEVAGRLGISEFAVKSRLIRARCEVRKRWTKRNRYDTQSTEGVLTRASAHLFAV
jgi:RNA polymerase sigma-70 factor (ECF subfamily)